MRDYDFTGMAHIPDEYHVNFTIQAQRRDFEAQPPAKQQETLERVNRIVAQYPSSWLARHWREIYGGMA